MSCTQNDNCQFYEIEVTHLVRQAIGTYVFCIFFILCFLHYILNISCHRFGKALIFGTEDVN